MKPQLRTVRFGDGTPGWRTASGADRAVLLLHHRTGLDEFTVTAAARLCRAGYDVVIPDMFHGQPAALPPEERKRRMRDDIVLAVTAAAADHAARTVGGRPPLAVGFCMGGRLAFLVATAGLVSAACCFYGGGLDRGWHCNRSPIERVNGGQPPVQMHRGSLDSAATAPQQDAAIAAAAEVGVYLEACTYAGARHAFLNRTDPVRYHPAAAAHAWSSALGFLDAHA